MNNILKRRHPRLRTLRMKPCYFSLASKVNNAQNTNISLFSRQSKRAISCKGPRSTPNIKSVYCGNEDLMKCAFQTSRKIQFLATYILQYPNF